MLNFYHRLARVLFRLRWLLWSLLGASVVGFVVILFAVEGPASESYLLGCALGGIWLLSTLCVAHGFISPLPVSPPGTPWTGRFMVWLKRAFLWLMALLMSVVSVAVAFLSLRALGIMFGG